MIFFNHYQVPAQFLQASQFSNNTMVPPQLFPNLDTLHLSFKYYDSRKSGSSSYWISSPIDDAKERFSTYGKNIGEYSKEIAQDTHDTIIGLANDAQNLASQSKQDARKKTTEISQEASSQASSWFGFFKGKADATSKEANKTLEKLASSTQNAALQLSEDAKNTASQYSQQASNTANQVTNDVKSKSSSVSDWLGGVSENASNTADQYVKGVDAKLNEISSEAKSTVDQLSQNATSVAEETASKAPGWLSSFSKNTKSTVDNYSKQANDSLNQATNEAQKDYDKAKTDYNAKYNEYSKQVDQAVNQIDKDLTQGTEKAKGWLSSFFSDASGKVDQVTKDVDNSLNQLSSEAQRAASKFSSDLQETTNQYSNQVNDSVKKIDDELNEAARKTKGWLSSLSSDASNAASNATENLKKGVSDYKNSTADMASKLIDDIKDDTYGAAQTANEKVTQITNDARQQVANFTRDAESQLNFLTKTIEPPKPSIPLYSNKYFATCALGGVLACGITHSAVTPLDLVKCRLQVDPTLYKGNFHAWKTIVSTESAGALFTGLGATFVGYSLQGAGKYGFYEYFKYAYSNIVGKDIATNYTSLIYLSASASAEFIADILLCPWEAIKVKTQTSVPPYASSVLDGYRKMAATGGFYGGLIPLWLRQIPYTMVKFATFEKTVEAIYSYLPKSKDQYSLVSQTGVSFLGGYIAGIFCAIVSHPADVMVSKVNAERRASETTGAAVSRIYSKIGFGGLWNGLPVRIVMIGTLTGLQWLLYDSFKAYVGLPTTGGAKK